MAMDVLPDSLEASAVPAPLRLARNARVKATTHHIANNREPAYPGRLAKHAAAVACRCPRDRRRGDAASNRQDSVTWSRHDLELTIRPGIDRQSKIGNFSVAVALSETVDRRHLPVESKRGGEMGKLNGIELKRARLVPSSMFTSPDAVVRSADLSRAQKIQILRRWEFDARRTPNGDPAAPPGDVTGLLDQVQGALAVLGALPTAPPGRAITTDATRH